MEGESFFLWLEVEGEHPLQVSWAQDGRSLVDQTNVQLHVGAARLRDAGSYICTVSNAQGRITCDAATVSVEPRCLLNLTECHCLPSIVRVANSLS